MRARSTVAVLATACAVLGMSTACVRTGTCVSWVDFETPQEAFDDARLVVVGTAEPTGATRDVFGVPMPVYAIDVTETHKGEAPDGLRVTPAPLTCMGDASEFPNGVDPLANDDELVLFLHLDDGDWRPINPTDGELPFEASDR